MANINKTQNVDTILTLLADSPNFVLFRHESTTHQALEELRRELKKTGSKVRIVKNTLFEKALQKKSQGDALFTEFVQEAFPLRQSTALITIGDDYAATLASFAKFAKSNKTISFRLGVLDNTVYLGENLQKIALLPSKEELIAKLIGGLKASPYKLTYAMKFNITKLTLTLKERAKQAN